MITDGQREPPPYITPVEGQGDEVNHPHIPFNPNSSQQASNITPVYTSGGGGNNSQQASNITPVYTGLESEDGKKKFVSYDTVLGRTPDMTTCTSCQQQVMTNVTYKAGMYAWLMALLFAFCGALVCVVFIGVIPLFLKKFKDVYHTCPICNRVLHVEKKQCCK